MGAHPAILHAASSLAAPGAPGAGAAITRSVAAARALVAELETLADPANDGGTVLSGRPRAAAHVVLETSPRHGRARTWREDGTRGDRALRVLALGSQASNAAAGGRWRIDLHDRPATGRRHDRMTAAELAADALAPARDALAILLRLADATALETDAGDVREALLAVATEALATLPPPPGRPPCAVASSATPWSAAIVGIQRRDRARPGRSRHAPRREPIHAVVVCITDDGVVMRPLRVRAVTGEDPVSTLRAISRIDELAPRTGATRRTT